MSVLLWLVVQADVSVWWVVLLIVFYTGVLVLGAICIRWNFYLVSVNRGGSSNCIALSFDDGPAAETAAIADILKKERVPAAFFSIGKHAAAHPDLVRRWDEEGHIVGNHSFYHGFNFDWQTSSRMKKEIDDTNDVIEQIIGKRPRFFRPPYGVTNPNLAKAVLKADMHSIAWSVRSFDTSAGDGEQLLARILNQLSGGDIILLHDSVHLTREILTELIKCARERGFTFVRLDKLIGTEPYA